MTPDDTTGASAPRHRYRPMKAGELAARLAEHPDADVHLMVPAQNAILGTMFFGNDDGSMADTPHGVFLLGISLFGDEIEPG
jgi:hypothetical protein